MKYGPDNHDTALRHGDRFHMVMRGWFPQTDLSELEELRERHGELISQREAKQGIHSALQERFEQEDNAKQAELNRSYLEGGLPEPVECTPPEERVRLLAEAHGHAQAAARAVVTFVYEARERLRGCEDLPDGWNPYLQAQAQRVPPGGIAERALTTISQAESELREQITAAQRTIQAAELRLRQFTPLRHWLAVNGNASGGQIMRGTDLEVPVAYTEGTKPRDLDVPGWWKDSYGDDTVVSEGEEHLIPDDAESAVVEMTDPEILAMEAKQNA